MVSRRVEDCVRRISGGAQLGAMVGFTFGAIAGGMEAMGYREIPASQKVGVVLRKSLGGSVAFGLFVAVGTLVRGGGC
ncbi:hypothetical protein FVE85_7655 [Porphyridium purpureum]|uniref:Reactive oxygen species modulator 1 n=1 Tax=Porphyridium purpureum TaxID=35688 RepID=A0A5J4ZAB8_PORPP|nr:hypothetical protein FVE85_7655 [Porphyridium purpureum]|eukprot:POR6181..scf295_1